MTFFITQCPHCKTSFRASVTQLESAEGMVRCGACLNVFAADDNLLPSSEIKTALNRDKTPQPSFSGDYQDSSEMQDATADEEEQDLIFTLDMADSFSDRVNPIISEEFESQDSETDQALDAQHETTNLHAEDNIETDLADEQDFRVASGRSTNLSAGMYDEPDSLGTDSIAVDMATASSDYLEDDRDNFWLDHDQEDKSDSTTTFTITQSDDDLESLDPNVSGADFSEDIRTPSDELEESALDPSINNSVSNQETSEPSSSASANNLDAQAHFNANAPETPELETPFVLVDNDDTKPSPHFRFSAIDDDQFFVDDDDHDASKKALSTDDIASVTNMNEPLELDWQEKEPSDRSSFIGISLILFLCLGLAAQTAWLLRDNLARNMTTRPLLEQACELFGCTLAKLYDIDAIASESLVVKSHEEFSNALSVNIILRNDAPFAQAFPGLSLRFTNAENEVVAQRDFKPGEYLSRQLTQFSAMPPATPVQVNFAILDPGLEAVNYEVSFTRLN